MSSGSLGMMRGGDGIEPQEVIKYIKIIRPDREVSIAELADNTLICEVRSRLAVNDNQLVVQTFRLLPETWALVNQAMVVAMDYFEIGEGLTKFIEGHMDDGLTKFTCAGGKQIDQPAPGDKANEA